jgi:hypothetical protein
MELRLLSTEAERHSFAEHLVEARMTRGAGFKETEESVMGDIHLAFGRLYGLFDETGSKPDEMLAGFSLHNLATFGQSYSKPDLSHLPPESVLECGELWAMAAGGARLARHGAKIIGGLLQAQACLVYPIFKPWNLTSAYKEFRPVGDPIEWPYAQTLVGEKIYVQAMVLDGAALRRAVREAWAMGFETIERHRVVRFPNLFPISSAINSRALRKAGQELNGTAHA